MVGHPDPLVRTTPSSGPRDLREGARVPSRGPREVRVRPPRSRSRAAGRDRAPRRTAVRPLLDDRRASRRRHSGREPDGHPPPALRDAGVLPGRSPRQDGDDGGVRHAEHRHRRGVLRGRVSGTEGPGAVPSASRIVVSLEQGVRFRRCDVRVEDLELEGDRRDAGSDLRGANPGDHRRPPPHSVRLRRDLGTALNRFIAQAVLGLPITPYGKGEQRRGFIALEDSMQSLRIAVENPPRLANTGCSISSTQRTP